MHTINLEQIKNDYRSAVKVIKRRIIICAGTGCVANGSLKIFAEFSHQIELKGLNHLVEISLKEEPIDHIQIGRAHV